MFNYIGHSNKIPNVESNFKQQVRDTGFQANTTRVHTYILADVSVSMPPPAPPAKYFVAPVKDARQLSAIFADWDRVRLRPRLVIDIYIIVF